MIGKILSQIVTSLFSAIIAKIDAWFTQQQLAEAQSKAEGLKAYLKSIEESSATEDEMKAAKVASDKAYDETKTYKQKLKALSDLAEARRLKKIKAKMEKGK